MKVAFQGEPGAYSEQAILNFFGPVDSQPCKTFEAAFEAAASGACDAAMIPIENSIAGSVHENYDLLLRHDLHIVGEYFLPVHHCLIALPGAAKSEIKKAISHPQALAQCASYLRNLGLQAEAVYDTAGSVMMLKASGDLSVAAIASRRAAEIHGMQILEENVEDDARNFTRFLALQREPKDSGEELKTSIAATLANHPGALSEVFAILASRDLNITKIESRPIPGEPWNYYFFLDFVTVTASDAVQSALEQLAKHTSSLRVLGSYPRGALPN